MQHRLPPPTGEVDAELRFVVFRWIGELDSVEWTRLLPIHQLDTSCFMNVPADQQSGTYLTERICQGRAAHWSIESRNIQVGVGTGMRNHDINIVGNSGPHVHAISTPVREGSIPSPSRIREPKTLGVTSTHLRSEH